MIGLVLPTVVHGAHRLQSSVVAVVEQGGVPVMSGVRGSPVRRCSIYTQKFQFLPSISS
jgi:hypothetical protein